MWVPVSFNSWRRKSPRCIRGSTARWNIEPFTVTRTCSNSGSLMLSSRGRRWNSTGFGNAGARPSTVRESHDDHYFIGTRSICHHHRDGVDLIKRPDVIFVAERHIDRGTDRSDFDIGRDDGLASADGIPDRFAHSRMQNSRAMFNVSGDADDGGFSVGDHWVLK